jgi:uncharacterized protein YfaT (DUF1175 family)
VNSRALIPDVTKRAHVDMKDEMSTLKTAEKAVASLSEGDFSEFRRWFEEYEAKRFDNQIERDAKAGKLDFLAREALEDHEAGRTKPL